MESPADRLAEPPAWALDAPARKLLDALGPEARFVGGCVRDALIGAAPADLDLGVPYPPEETVARLKRAKLRAIPTGIAHGTVTAAIEGRNFEVTSLRRDVETFGRHARVAFGADWREDAARRDFTINALSMAPDGALYDYFGGRADLAARRVRFIGDARARIGEDVLRLLRFFRFHARFGGDAFDPPGLAACRACAASLPGLSAERVRAEMFRLIEGPRAAAMLAAMREAGALAHWLPEADGPALARLASLARFEAAAGEPPDAIRALAVFDLDARNFAARWRLSNAEGARLARLRAPPARVTLDADAPATRRAFYALGVDLRDRVLIDAADFTDVAAALERHRRAQAWTRPTSPVGGADLRALGIEPGPGFGELLHKIESTWIASDFAASKESLLELAKNAARA